MGHGCVQVPGCVEGHPWNSPHRGPVMWKATPCDGFIMNYQLQSHSSKIKFIPHRKIRITTCNYGEKLEYIYIYFSHIQNKIKTKYVPIIETYISSLHEEFIIFSSSNSINILNHMDGCTDTLSIHQHWMKLDIMIAHNQPISMVSGVKSQVRTESWPRIHHTNDFSCKIQIGWKLCSALMIDLTVL